MRLRSRISSSTLGNGICFVILLLVSLAAMASAAAQSSTQQAEPQAATPSRVGKPTTPNKKEGDADKQVTGAAAPDEEKKEEPTGAPKKNQAKSVRPAAKKEQPTKVAAEKTDEAKPETPKDPYSSATFNGMKLRNIGPAFTSGRVVAFAVDPRNRAKYYVAAASGGVWKTENAGNTWTPVFEKEGSYSIGAVALDPKDSSVVWVGTGEGNSQRSVGYGDGVYRSEDGGKNWKNVGLKHSEHIGRLVIDPRDSNTVYVAAEGPLWGPGGDRGLYKTADGGKTWKSILNISENTGVADVVLDPQNPDLIYAASYQRRRHVWTLIDGGPESAIYRSTDAGVTWTKLKSGLPTEDMGRIGLAVSPVESNVLYATIEAANKKGGIFRSRDRGATWEKRNDYDQTAMYYGQIVADPKNVDRVYVMGFLIQVSDDGGKTLHALGEKNKHVDNHAMWIDPNDTNYYLVGCDGGVYESYDRGATWGFKSNLPITQFYDVAVDNSRPFYYVFGGTQDNYSMGGPSRTPNASGIVNSDWFVTQGGDGFRSQIDPEDPYTIYAEYQYGGLARYDRRTGERVGIQPQEEKGGEPYRWNWDSPLLISPHSHTRIYFAANRLFRSEDRGDTWKAISPDLSRRLDRDKLPVMGRIWGPDAVAKNASTSFYGNIVALAESPKKEGLLYVGTDDGLMQITQDGGGTWKKSETFPGVPGNTYVSRIIASSHNAGVVYASFDNHKNADFKPYLLKSSDQGGSWTSIASNLPANGPVLAIAEDPVNPNLLFVGTEFGMFFSSDGGGKWIQLKGGFPTIAVRDLVVHPRDHDLVAATFGRGFYVLDDITPLRSIRPESLTRVAQLFPPRDTVMYVQAQPIGGRGKSFQGEAFYTADNPPFGAVFTYYLKDKLKTRREKRQDAEKEAARKNSIVAYPTKDDLRAEAEEEAPKLFLTVTDAEGRPVRRIAATNAAGISRVAWDLRYPNLDAVREERKAPAPGEDEEERGGSEMVMPGKYSATLSQKVGQAITDIAGPVSFNVVVPNAERMDAQDLAKLSAFQRRVSRLNRAVRGALAASDDMKKRVQSLKRALLDTPGASRELLARADAIDEQLSLILRAVRGDVTLAGREENIPRSISARLDAIVGEERMSTAKPTQTHLDAYSIASQEFAGELAKLHRLGEQDLPQLERDAEKAGAPWTAGRLPDWQEQP